MTDTFVRDVKKLEVKTIIGYYYPTAKNKMVKEFYRRMGFGLVNSDEEGNTIWKLDMDCYEPKCSFIEIER